MTSPKRDLWSWTGIWIVGITAAVWSFTALSDLADYLGIKTVIDLWGWWQIRVAWGLPITVDTLAVVATRVWLRGTAPAAAVAYAQKAAWTGIGASVLGNAYHGLVKGDWRVDALLVSAVPAVVIGVLVHLAVLVSRPAPALEQQDQSLHSVPDPRAERDRLAEAWKTANPELGARALSAYLIEQGHQLSPSGAQSAYFAKSAS